MKKNIKLLIAAMLFIFIGLIAMFTLGLINSGLFQAMRYGTSNGYTLGSEDMMNLTRNYNFDNGGSPKSFSFEEVKSAAENYLEKKGLKDLQIVEIMEFSNNFYIKTIEKSTKTGAMEFLFDKGNGAIFPEFGPNMMWNSKYGMMQRINESQNDVNMKIDEEKAIEIANNYLAKTKQNEFAEDKAQKFYGYYTIDTVTKNGTLVGMLSVNGFTGQVWYHNWHGVFIEEKEY